MASLKPSERAREEKPKGTQFKVGDQVQSDNTGDVYRVDAVHGHEDYDVTFLFDKRGKGADFGPLVYKGCDLIGYGVFRSAPPPHIAAGNAMQSVGLSCALIEAMRRDFAILHALRPGQTAGDLAAALGEPPLGKGV
jgi:hypothetical protein